MKVRILILSLIISLLGSDAIAQTSAVQKAGKSVFTLTTYKPDGSIKATTHGVYFGEKGEGIAAFTPFIGASSATIIDASGKKSEVTAIIGANEMYDICRFKLSNQNGTPLVGVQSEADGTVWTVGYSVKKPNIRALNVASKEKFLDKYTYYIFKEEIEEDNDGCPIVNAEGQLVGLVQRSSSSYIIHSTDANYYSILRSSGFANHDRLLQKTLIRSALPNDLEQARVMLFTIDGLMDSMSVVNTVRDFNAMFPTEFDGYHTMARYQFAHGNQKAVDQTMSEALKNCTDKAEVYLRYSEMIYNHIVYSPDSLSDWTLDKAEALVNEAIAINPLPAFTHHLAKIHYTKGDVQKAFDLYSEVAESELKGSELFYEMAQCKARLEAPAEEVLQLLNKSVEMCQHPLNHTHAPYYLARGNWLESMDQNKLALMDYNTYDSLQMNRADAGFYYTRFKCELKLRQFQQALNDIAHAAYLEPQEVTYLAEMASLNLRVGHYEDAVGVCNLAETITNDYSDIYVVKGVALAQLGRKEEALQAFARAKELGDERADGYIEKYGK